MRSGGCTVLRYVVGIDVPLTLQSTLQGAHPTHPTWVRLRFLVVSPSELHVNSSTSQEAETYPGCDMVPNQIYAPPPKYRFSYTSHKNVEEAT
jgi:hypothetical protein